LATSLWRVRDFGLGRYVMVVRSTSWRDLDASDGPVGKGAGLVCADDGPEAVTGDGPLDGWTDDTEFDGALTRLGDGVL
jgi:hypothetical protein